MANALLTNGWKVSTICWERGQTAATIIENSDLYKEYKINFEATTGSAYLIFRMPGLYLRIRRTLKLLDRYDAIVMTHFFLLPVATLIGTPRPKIFYDAPEYYCDDFLAYFGKFGSSLRPLVRLVEKILIQPIDKIFTIDSNRGWLAEYYNRLGKPAQVIWNLPDKAEEADPAEVDRLEKIYNDRNVVIYVGSIKFAKGIENILRAIPRIVINYPEVLFLFVGEIQGKKDEISSLVEKIGVSKHVRFKDKMKYQEMMAYVSISKVGLAVLQRGRNDLAGEGNCRKIFTYMQGGIPVLTTNVGQVGEFVSKNNIGVVIESDSIELLTEHVCNYLGSSEKCNMHGQNGRNKFESNYNWTNESFKFVREFNLVVDRQNR